MLLGQCKTCGLRLSGFAQSRNACVLVEASATMRRLRVRAMKKVLLCDDEIHILRAAEMKVAKCGYEVRTANDGEQAWKMIQADMPDVLVTDVQMPRMDGFELARRVRECPATRDLPIIMLTAKGFELDRHELLEKWGIVDLLPKPFSPRELVRTLEQVLVAV
jgi:two-component system, OmpR family, alkaline phosphatase synthesis response regulator PhoP